MATSKQNIELYYPLSHLKSKLILSYITQQFAMPRYSSDIFYSSARKFKIGLEIQILYVIVLMKKQRVLLQLTIDFRQYPKKRKQTKSYSHCLDISDIEYLYQKGVYVEIKIHVH